MKEIGGYFGLECGNTPLYYKDGIYLNSCRNALRYLIRCLGIQRIYVPVFTCSAIEEAIEKEKCELIKYNIGYDFFPVQNIPVNEFIIYNNYFGVNGKNVEEMIKQFPNLIVDNAQSFFSENTGRAAIYSLRKFFGVPDGGIIRGRGLPEKPLDKSVSYDVMSHLLIRKDLGAKDGYPYFLKDEEIIDKYPVLAISKLTKDLLGNINYMEVKKKRIENFSFLQKNLQTDFPLLQTEKDIPLVFPFFRKDGETFRNHLIVNNIFCARYWPNVLYDKKATSFEINLAKNMVSIPIDQRYSIEEMNFIINLIDGKNR